MRQRVTDDLRLLVNLLGHEMAIIALIEQKRRSRGPEHRPLDHPAGGIADFDAIAPHYRPVAVLEIADGIRQWRQRDSVRPQVHLALAVAHRERRALAGADQKILLAVEQERE